MMPWQRHLMKVMSKRRRNEVTNQVLAELGVELDSKMVGLDAPNKAPPKKEGEQEQGISEEEAALMDALPDLRARLDAL